MAERLAGNVSGSGEAAVFSGDASAVKTALGVEAGQGTIYRRLHIFDAPELGEGGREIELRPDAPLRREVDVVDGPYASAVSVKDDLFDGLF